ncbi:MAG: DNA polymerase I [Candidatus Omnitrophica bacterium]|nr:DNA polymerase I [Candidatus Omnitrophota bacterium]
MANPRLFLIDAHALCYRAFFAVRDLATSKGQPTNAVFGFINILKKILRDYQPEYVAVCFDSGKKTHRQEKYAEYKIQRPSMPPALIEQIPVIKEVVKAYNLTVFELGGFEADDIIATLAQQGTDKKLDVVIVSEDKDMYQLVDENVKILNPRKEIILDQKALEEQLGFSPEHIVDFIALAGDQSDNIPGVKGIGEVTARKLIGEYKTLENILKHIDIVTPQKVKEKIEEQKDMAVLSKELAVLATKVPFEMDLKQLKVESPDNERLFKLFKELEFKKLLSEVAPLMELPVQRSEPLGNVPVPELLEKIQKKGEFVFLVDTIESEAINQAQGMVVAIDSQSYYLSSKEAKELMPVWNDKGILKITHDIKKALAFLESSGMLGQGKSGESNLERFNQNNFFDVMLAGYLLKPGQSAFSLESLCWDFLKNTLTADQGPTEGAKYVYQLYKTMNQELEQKALKDLFHQIEMPLAYVLFQIEKNGVRLDMELLKSLSKECDKTLQSLTAKIYKDAGQEFNLNSPKQLGFVMFEKMKLPVIKKTKTGYSTDEEVLSRLAVSHEFPKSILEYRQIAKLKSTYIDALPVLVDAKTHRIHAQFNQTGAETGRLSSSRPNLQNIPIRTELGRQVRKAIIPSEDYLLLAADYSQIELRILAHLSGDETLKKAFETDEDIHSYTASLIFDTKEKEVTKQMRDSAKRVNFGIIYGMSSFGLARDLGVSNAEAQDFIDRYFLRYPKVKVFMDKMIKDCEKNGFVTTLLNRRRYIPEINSPNNSIRQFAQRQAINTPVQGSAADLIKLAMVNVQQELERDHLKSRMLITVHDELVFDVDPQEKGKVIKLVRNFMETPLKLSVPIKVTVKTGDNWLEMKEEKV